MCNAIQVAPDNIVHEKILFSVAVILLKQHCTGKFYAILPKRLQTTLHRKKRSVFLSEQHQNLTNVFFFLIITGCCKRAANIAKISSTLHKKNPWPTLNKNTRLYRTVEKIQAGVSRNLEIKIFKSATLSFQNSTQGRSMDSMDPVPLKTTKNIRRIVRENLNSRNRPAPINCFERTQTLRRGAAKAVSRNIYH